MEEGSERIFLLSGKVCLEWIVEKGIGYAADGYMVLSLHVVWDNADFCLTSQLLISCISSFFLLFGLHKLYLCFDKLSLKMQHHLCDSEISETL